MRTEDVTRAIMLILAPVGMVTTCAILLGGLLSRFAAINDRLRALNRERLDLLHLMHDLPDAYIHERLREIDMQVPDLLRRLTLAQRAVFAAYGAITVFLLSMFSIAALAITGEPWVATATLIGFLVGTLVLFVGVLFVIEEVRTSRNAVRYEVTRVGQLRRFVAQAVAEARDDA